MNFILDVAEQVLSFMWGCIEITFALAVVLALFWAGIWFLGVVFK